LSISALIRFTNCLWFIGVWLRFIHFQNHPNQKPYKVSQ